MEKLAADLKVCLSKLVNGAISLSELTHLVQLSRSLVQSFLQHIRTDVHHLCESEGLSIRDVSYDCIAEIFAKDERGRLRKLEAFLGSLRADLSDLDEIEILLAFKSFLFRVADTQLARLYAQADPAGARIHRNIRDACKKSSLFQISQEFRRLVLRPLGAAWRHDASVFPPDQLEEEFLRRATGARSTIELLHVLHDILTGQSAYRPSISVAEAVQLFKKVYSYGELEENASLPSTSGLTDFEIERLAAQVELVLQEKILLTYFARGKVNRREAGAMFDAFHDIISDWCSAGESQRSLSESLRRYLPMDERAYERDFRSKMEYLLKIAREEFAARLMREI